MGEVARLVGQPEAAFAASPEKEAECSVSFSSPPRSPAAWLPSFPLLSLSSSKWARLKRRPPATSQSLMRELLLAKLIVLFPAQLHGLKIAYLTLQRPCQKRKTSQHQRSRQPLTPLLSLALSLLILNSIRPHCGAHKWIISSGARELLIRASSRNLLQQDLRSVLNAAQSSPMRLEIPPASLCP